MASYRTPKPRDTRVADLVGANVAVRVVETKIDVVTQHGTSDVVIGDTWILTTSGAEPKGNVWYWNQYLREELEGAGDGEWFVGRIVKPDQAYFWAELDAALLDIARDLIDGTSEEQF